LPYWETDGSCFYPVPIQTASLFFGAFSEIASRASPLIMHLAEAQILSGVFS